MKGFLRVPVFPVGTYEPATDQVADGKSDFARGLPASSSGARALAPERNSARVPTCRPTRPRHSQITRQAPNQTMRNPRIALGSWIVGATQGEQKGGEAVMIWDPIGPMFHFVLKLIGL